jgi:uncharacterized membrane protein YphA (DoxX/SURF4 family)
MGPAAPPPAWRTRTATACAWLVGAIFLLTGFAKAHDLYGFIEKAAYYRAVPTTWIRPAALATIALELVLALLLFLRWRPKLVAGVAIAVLVGFSALIVHAWRVYGIEDCGCLGSMADTPPGASLVKNGLLTVALVWVARVPTIRRQDRRRLYGALAASATLAAFSAWLLLSQV